MEVLAILLLGLLAGCHGELTINVAASVEIADIGSDVTVRCRLSGHDVFNLVYLWKNQAGQDTQIGTNNLINEVFNDTGRYSATAEKLGEDHIFAINIKGAKPEDSGQYGCSVPNVPGSKTYTRFDVMAPLTDIKLFALKNDGSEDAVELTDGQDMHFNEGDEYFFRCVASGSNYEPAFTFTLGEKDVTSFFTSDVEHHVSNGQPGLKRLIYTATSENTEPVAVSINDNALVFTCAADTPGADTPPLSIHVKPVLRFAPIIKCQDEVVRAAYDSAVEDVSCVVKADPPVEFIEWSWVQRWENGDEVLTEKHVLKEGEYKLKYSHHIKPGPHPDEKTSTLYMSRVFPDMFREYTIYTKNELGSAEKTVLLKRDNTGAVGAASSLYAGSLAMLLSLASLLALRS